MNFTYNSEEVKTFELYIELLSNEEWDYEYELNDKDFSIKYSDRDNLSREEAQDEMERILSDVTINLDHSIGNLQEAFLGAIEIDLNDIKEWHFEIEYEDQSQIAAKFDRS